MGPDIKQHWRSDSQQWPDSVFPALWTLGKQEPWKAPQHRAALTPQTDPLPGARDAQGWDRRCGWCCSGRWGWGPRRGHSADPRVSDGPVPHGLGQLGLRRELRPLGGWRGGRGPLRGRASSGWWRLAVGTRRLRGRETSAWLEAAASPSDGTREESTPGWGNRGKLARPCCGRVQLTALSSRTFSACLSALKHLAFCALTGPDRQAQEALLACAPHRPSRNRKGPPSRQPGP